MDDEAFKKLKALNLPRVTVISMGEFEDDEVPHNDRELKTSLRRHRCQPFVSAALLGMPVFPRTAMSSKPATKRRLSITPTS